MSAKLNLAVLLLLSFVFLSSGSYTLQLSFYYENHSPLIPNTSFVHKWVPKRPHSAPHGYLFSHSTPHIATLTPTPTSPTAPPGPPKCLLPNWVFWGLNISEPNLLPLTTGGILIGAGGVAYLTSPAAVHLRSHVSYAIIFAFFFIMNFSAIVLHCFSPTINNKTVSSWMFFLDGMGTSGVCLSFTIAALADLNIISDSGKLKLTLSGILFTAYAYGWYSAIFNEWPYGFPILYLLTTSLGSISYFILQFVWLFKTGFNKSSFYLLGAFVVGMLGLQTLKDPQLALYLCDHLPAWLAGETPWFTASDLALYLLFAYITKRESSMYAKLNSASSIEEGIKIQE